jgi:hypothetical protein
MKNLNELFKRKLAEQQFDGKEQYWAQLEKKLNEAAQEKVVVAWYKKWLLPAVAVLAVSAAAIYIVNLNSKKSNVSLVQQQSETVTEQTSAHEGVLSNPNQNIESINNVTNVNTLSTKGTENISLQNTSTTANNTSNTSKSNMIMAQKKLGIEKYKTTNGSTFPKNSNQELVALPSGLKTQKEPVLSNSGSDGLMALTSLTPDLIAQEGGINLPEETKDVNRNISVGHTITGQSLNFSLVEMPLALISPKALTALIYDDIAPNIANRVYPIKTAKSKNRLSLSVYGGAMYSLKNLMTQEGNSADYLNRRTQEESNSIKPNAGIDLEIKRGHWTFTSGINFHQQGEKRNYSDKFKRMLPYDSLVININDNSAWLIDSSQFYAVEYSSIITSYDTTITYYDEATGLFYTAQMPVNITQSLVSDTNYYYIVDSTYQSNIDTVKTNYSLKKQVVLNDPNQPNLKGRNTFSYLEVPVLFGYEWGVRRWRLSVKGGVGIGLLSRQQSFYLSTDEAEIAPVSTQVYTKIMYNAIVRAGLHYSFTPQFGIDIVPFSRLNINNMSNKNADFKQKYGNVGLQLGLNYKL